MDIKIEKGIPIPDRVHPIVHLVSQHFKVPAHDVMTSMASNAIRARLCAVLLLRECSNVTPEEVVVIMPVIVCPCGHGSYASVLKDATDLLVSVFGKDKVQFETPAQHKFTSDFYELKLMLTTEQPKRPSKL